MIVNLKAHIFVVVGIIIIISVILSPLNLFAKNFIHIHTYCISLRYLLFEIEIISQHLDHLKYSYGSINGKEITNSRGQFA